MSAGGDGGVVGRATQAVNYSDVHCGNLMIAERDSKPPRRWASEHFGMCTPDRS
jgi:hypothetical protein